MIFIVPRSFYVFECRSLSKAVLKGATAKKKKQIISKHHLNVGEMFTNNRQTSRVLLTHRGGFMFSYLNLEFNNNIRRMKEIRKRKYSNRFKSKMKHDVCATVIRSKIVKFVESSV